MPPNVAELHLSNFLKIKLQLLEKLYNNKYPNYQRILIKKINRPLRPYQKKIKEVPITGNPKRIIEVEVIPTQMKGNKMQFNQNQLELAVEQINDKVPNAQLKSQIIESSVDEKKPKLPTYIQHQF